MAANKVIISCAITGSIHTPSMSPHLPVTAEEIAASALGAAEAGAAIVHLHARNPVDGRPDQSPEAFEPFLRVIKQSSDVVVNLTTGGSPYMTVEERVGLEDSLWLGRGELAPSNTAQVARVRQIIEGLGLEVASPQEARAILELKGGDAVGF